LSSNGDSLWSKKLNRFGGTIDKFVKSTDGKLFMAFSAAKKRIYELDPTTGDSITSFQLPSQFQTWNYIIYDMEILPNGEFAILHGITNGGNGSAIQVCSRGSTTNTFADDYAAANFKAVELFVDGTDLVMAGYTGYNNWYYKYRLKKNSNTNSPIWDKSLNSVLGSNDMKVGLEKTGGGSYLLGGMILKTVNS
jgi:hypothetical protein